MKVTITKIERHSPARRVFRVHFDGPEPWFEFRDQPVWYVPCMADDELGAVQRFFEKTGWEI